MYYVIIITILQVNLTSPRNTYSAGTLFLDYEMIDTPSHHSNSKKFPIHQFLRLMILILKPSDVFQTAVCRDIANVRLLMKYDIVFCGFV